MANYVETKDNSLTKVKAAMKEDVMDYIIQCLIDKYGEENCGYVRNGSGNSKVKEYAVRIGTVDAEGEEYPCVVCVNASAKDYREHTSDKGKVYNAYEFNIMRELYEEYLEEKAEKAASAKKSKEKKIAADQARREAAKKKAEEDELIDF